jgi:nucleotide-binding universal stress UspA family protein
VFKHILIPLDGSRMAEAALPVAAALAAALGASVTLIHVIERDAPSEVHSDRHLTDAQEAAAYLAEVAARALPIQVAVETHVHTNEVRDVARSIVEHADELNPDLIVMCTHGRSGLRDVLLGSIAQQVIAHGRTPVLLITPHDRGEGSFQCRQVLVPLDGDPEHELGLPVAVKLAQTLGAALHLLMVIPTLETLKGERAATGRMLPGAMRALLDLNEQGGKDYLARQLEAIRASGLSLSGEVARGKVVAHIVEAAARVHADLIVMGTHGKAGMDAFWSGSVTPRLSGRSDIPLLLVPLRNKEPGSSS